MGPEPEQMPTEGSPLSGASPTPGAQAERRFSVSLPPLLSGDREKSGSGKLFPPAGWGREGGCTAGPPKTGGAPLGERVGKEHPEVSPHEPVSHMWVSGTEQSSPDLRLHQRTLNKHPLPRRLPLNTLTTGPPSVPRKYHHISRSSDNPQISQKSILSDSQQATGVQGCLFRSLLDHSLSLFSHPFPLDHCQPPYLTSHP